MAASSRAARRRGADDSGFVIAIAGGVASFAEQGSPFNKVAGLGFAGVPGTAALDEVERATAAGVEVRPSGGEEFADWLDVVTDGVAQLTGAATAPAHRHRGVHTALLSARLADAAGAGCDIAVITTQPGSRSQHNAQRRGFDILYTRAILMMRPARDSS